MASSTEYLAYLVVFAFTTTGLPEEVMKYLLLSMIRDRQQGLRAKDYTTYATMIGLGYSFFESIIFIWGSAKDDTSNMIVVTALERVLYGTAAHVLTAVLTGTLMARRDIGGEALSLWRILGPSTLYHGIGNLSLALVSAWDGQVGFVHPQTGLTYLKYIAVPLVNLLACGFHVGANLRQIGVRSLLS